MPEPDPFPPRPARGRPERAPLAGRYVRLEPIAAHHVDGLYAASSDAGAAERYRWLSDYAPQDRAAMAAWVEKAMRADDRMFFAVLGQPEGVVLGRQALLRIVPADGVIEIGGVYWGPAMARTRRATEALYLAARHVFDDLGYRRLEWKCNDHNAASKAAATRFGFRFEGVFRQHMIQKGENRDTAWFAMLDRDWPRLKAGFEAWLDPGNFDEDGRQKTRLHRGTVGEGAA